MKETARRKATKKRKGAKKSKEIPPGTLRIKTDDLLTYEKTARFWRKSFREFPEAKLVINLYRASRSFDILIDKKDPTFLKGQLSPKGLPQGARIKFLPNGKELDKGFCLFSQELTIHDEASDSHWSVMYKNPGGTYSYVYTLEAKQKFIDRKYRAVKEFEKLYPVLERNIHKALANENDTLAVPMYTLLKTCMRVGNETYYRMNRHQGLRTLQKKDIVIKGNDVIFDYIGKDGVPTNLQATFPSIYIQRLKKILRKADERSFVFVQEDKGSPIQDTHFKEAFKRYCGKEFYPHIVRSYYATRMAKKFLETNKSPTKEAVQELFRSIAQKLGHKRYVRDEDAWKESYNVTVNHYIDPALVRKIKASISK